MDSTKTPEERETARNKAAEQAVTSLAQTGTSILLHRCCSNTHFYFFIFVLV